jgi:subtilase family serine protease
MSKGPTSHREPSLPYHRRYLRTASALFATAILLGGGTLLLVSSASAVPGVPTGGFTAPVNSQVLSGSELANGAFTTRPGTVLATTPNTTVLRPTPTNTQMQFTVGFPIRNENSLSTLLNEQETIGSPLFHHWLTLPEETSMFGADPVAVQNTINYFTGLGFTVQTQGPLSVSFLGNAGMVNGAFRTQISDVLAANGTPAYTFTTPLSLPSQIAGSITTINGLDTTSEAKVASQFDPQLTQDALSGASGIPQGQVAPAITNLTNLTPMFNLSNHAFGWVYYYSHHLQRNNQIAFVTASALNYVYQADPLINAGYNGDSTGTPITIAVVVVGGINPDDLELYSRYVWNNPMQIMNRMTAVGIDGSFGANGTLYYNVGGDELMLDIEYSATMAPGAHIIPVYGPCLCYTVIDDDYAYLASLATAVNVVSNSWGGPEDGSNFYGPTWENAITMHDYVMMLEARGTTVLASSADGGGFDTSSGELAGSNPATDPLILSVTGVRAALGSYAPGPYPTPNIGTTNFSLFTGLEPANYEMRIATATHLDYQSFWYTPFSNQTLTRAPPEASGGFGTSAWYNQSWYEHGIGIPDLGRSLGSGVAGEADFNQTILYDGQWVWGIGGTSEACPTTAGMIALIDDYERAHGHGAYLGDGNVPVYLLGNAWWNGNLSLDPYYDVTNGTSYWGNQGVAAGWAWPPGQKFPVSATGPTYGNTTAGWDFPTGWGSINVANFAYDLNTLYNLPGQFQGEYISNSTWDPTSWANFALNNSYTIHVNASTALQASNPHVTLVFITDAGVRSSWQPALTVTGFVPGYSFTLDTTGGVFTGPGSILFEFGNSVNRTLGFAYSYIAIDIPSTGVLKATVIYPTGGWINGGVPAINTFVGWFQNVEDTTGMPSPYANSVVVLVTLNGQPVYNAVVSARLPSAYDVVGEGTAMMNRLYYLGKPGAAMYTPIQSVSYTNVSGDALVTTQNVEFPSNYAITASYGTLTATTNITLQPALNVGTSDSYGGQYSAFNFPKFILQFYHQPTSAAEQNAFANNSVNESAAYDLMYGWQGEYFPVTVNNYKGDRVANDRVWLGTLDLGASTRFRTYEPSVGVVGVTNASDTAAYTNSTGQAYIQLPDNLSGPAGGAYGYIFGSGPYAGDTVPIDFVAADQPGQSNITSSYTEPCATPNPLGGSVSPYTLIQCTYNNSFQRNYSAAPLLVYPDPVSAWTQTRQGAYLDFFGSGSNISWGVTVNLPDNDPFINGIGYNWNPGTEHVVSVRACVDPVDTAACLTSVPAATANPPETNFQYWSVYGNLTASYAPGIHHLLVVSTDSEGHIFTYDHIFIVGSVTITDLSTSNVYSTIPFNLTWNINIPFQEVSNKTFNQSLEVLYVTTNCQGFRCPRVENLTLPVKPEQTSYDQSINRTLLTEGGFYSGSGDLPPGQYELIVWLNANHSGSVLAQANTYLVFDNLAGQINGPSQNALVPLGNVTISYTYTGLYVQNANLTVYPGSANTPVYTVGALVPGIETSARGGSTTWTSTAAGPYRIVLELGTPYENYTATSWINVTLSSALVWFNGTSGQHPVGGLPTVATGTVLAIAGLIVGLLVGIAVAPAFRPLSPRATGAGGASKGSAKPWEEGSSGAGAGATECRICHEKFETPNALSQHGKIQHGLEE